MPAITGVLVLGEQRWPSGRMAGSGGRRSYAWRCWRWSQAPCPTFTCTGLSRCTNSPVGRGAHAAVGRRDDCGRIGHAAGLCTGWPTRRRARRLHSGQPYWG